MKTPKTNWSAVPQSTIRQGIVRRSMLSSHARTSSVTSPSAETRRSTSLVWTSARARWTASPAAPSPALPCPSPCCGGAATDSCSTPAPDSEPPVPAYAPGATNSRAATHRETSPQRRVDAIIPLQLVP